MSDKNQNEVWAMARRPIDCPPKMLVGFGKTVLLSGEVPIENLQRGVPMAEMLFFAGAGKTIMGVTAVRYVQKIYHKHVFEQAGIPEMFNPDAVEAVWLSVNPEYRGMGIWNKLKVIRDAYVGDRPSFGVRRLANKPIDLKSDLRPVGTPFKASDKDHLVTIVARNHDPVYDPKKKLYYGY
jgi:hypothetical protein